ncbi:MAG: LOG family protein [Anaerohalosphaeraceae bacterium]
MNEKQTVITLFGTSRAGEQDEVFRSAEQMGALLARSGYAVANGGYGGVMLASARGAASVGGRVIGVTCRAFKRSPNPYLTEEIPTDTLTERLASLIRLGSAYLVFAGGTGTLLELADVWEHKNKGFPGTDKPIILMGNFWQPLVQMMAQADPKSTRCIRTAETPSEVLTILQQEGLR